MNDYALDREDIYLISERAQSLHAQGCNREAAILFEGLIAIDPENEYCLEALAVVYIGLGQHAKAVEAATRALDLDASNHSARARRCEAYLNMNRADEARADFAVLSREWKNPRANRLGVRIDRLNGGGKLLN